ncbi:DUF5683 domain-containing protein [Flavicella sp.]|uniref:DUF5683 domain-containing protein n=1 Tax=Flavicella sp. TaxID=2957742 RepID=UPI003018EEDA
MLIKYTYTCIFLLLLCFGSVKSQTTSIPQLTSEDVIKTEGYDPLTPSRAAFYSAIVPGLGQVYNNQYWKLPFVYGAMATSMYYFTINNSEYKRYRTAYKLREAGFQDEFTYDDGTSVISREGLVSAQKVYKQNRETSLILFLGFYVLQIVDASVSAHLLQFNIDDNITLNPQIYTEPNTKTSFVGLTFNYKF